jgi:anaphase-promoting complex subunit 8
MPIGARVLKEMATRSSELLLSIPLTKRDAAYATHESTFSTSTLARSRSPRPSLSFANPSLGPAVALTVPTTPSQHPHAPQVHLEPEDMRNQELQWEAQDEDFLATAHACIGAREFLRAVHLLRDRKSAKARFLSLYSQFMVSQPFELAVCFWYVTDGPARRVKRRLFEIGINSTVSSTLFTGV